MPVEKEQIVQEAKYPFLADEVVERKKEDPTFSEEKAREEHAEVMRAYGREANRAMQGP